MLEYQKVQRTPITQTAQQWTVSIPSKSAQSLSKEMSWLNDLVKSASTESISSESSEAVPSKTVTNLEQDAKDQAAVDKEFNQWLGLEIIKNEKELEEFNLFRYWQVFQLFKILQCNTQANF